MQISSIQLDVAGAMALEFPPPGRPFTLAPFSPFSPLGPFPLFALLPPRPLRLGVESDSVSSSLSSRACSSADLAAALRSTSLRSNSGCFAERAYWTYVQGCMAIPMNQTARWPSVTAGTMLGCCREFCGGVERNHIRARYPAVFLVLLFAQLPPCTCGTIIRSRGHGDFFLQRSQLASHAKGPTVLNSTVAFTNSNSNDAPKKFAVAAQDGRSASWPAMELCGGVVTKRPQRRS